MFSLHKYINTLHDKKIINNDIYYTINELRLFRNRLVHKPKDVDKRGLSDSIKKIKQIKNELRKKYQEMTP
jgi:uncharacterized protein YutE (UPF0331/DUF86 family)